MSVSCHLAGDTGDLKPLKVGSDAPFVTLTVDPHVASRVEESWSQLASRIKSLEEPEWENPVKLNGEVDS